ncbi:thioester reductase [Chromobacterium haemolyticum]|uniref:thioester reductase domain-containing protein n=1 Tax=Chromobacterium haemolyticum TaxID=394935 RepID=UPI0009DAF104|nr:thioester reductase domain-containing protein [Chromobacterium haemolyticum]OQS40295.1 thioester reductase [Chromobacterium haemolyticum]
MDYRAKTSVKNIVLTGPTGVLGGRLLQEILATTDANVYCVVRAENKDAARARIEDVLYCYDEGRKLSTEAWRIIPVLGDISQPMLGLDASAYRDLAHLADLVLHCAANVSLVASYNKIAPVNVGGTANLIELCLAGKAPLVFTSSFSMVGDKLYQPDFVLRETDLDVGQGFVNMDYERSKFTAERMVHEAGERGLDWVIVRPGNIWGDSRTGCYPLKQTKVKGIYYEMLKSLVETGLTFASDEAFDISPVDYVAQATLFAAMNLQSSNRRTYNLTNPRPISYDGIVARLRDYGYTLRDVPSKDYFEALQEGRMHRGGTGYRSTFTDLMAIFYDGSDCKEHAKYDTSEIQELLANTDIRCPDSDQALFGRYLDYACKVGFLNAPSAQTPLAEIKRQTSMAGGYMESLYDADLSDAAAVR